MLTKYVILVISGDQKDAKPTRVLTSRIIELEKLQENKLETQNHVGAKQWNKFMWNQQKKYIEKVSIWRLCFMVFQGRKYTLGQIQEKWFGPFKVKYCLPNNIPIFLLSTILNQIQYWSVLTN
jgi:hypothetical protein